MTENTEYRCPVCNEPLARYGNRELRDGCLCRNCVKLLSPFLSEKETAEKTAAEIKAHLDYRESNRKKIRDFLTTRKVEGKYNLLLDEVNDAFLFSKRKDIKRENPDVLRKEEVKSISIKEVPYQNNWKQADILLEVEVDSPYLSKVSFPVNEFPGLERNSDEFIKASALAVTYKQNLISFLAVDNTAMKELREKWYEEGGLEE